MAAYAVVLVSISIEVNILDPDQTAYEYFFQEKNIHPTPILDTCMVELIKPICHAKSSLFSFE